MMEWFFWPTRASYLNNPDGTGLFVVLLLIFGGICGAKLPQGRLRKVLWFLPFFSLLIELLASPAYSQEDWFFPVQLAFVLDGLAAMALALWLGYAPGSLFRRKPRAAA